MNIEVEEVAGGSGEAILIATPAFTFRVRFDSSQRVQQ